jgi:ATP-dependent helicase/nuclease subunit B
MAVQTRFLLGPAGSGKTFRCLAEIRRALIAQPDGAPLLLLAPKQATFQLERQLLAEPGLDGYTRLQILSFDRLAQYILSEHPDRPTDWLDEEGRVMVLRALLNQHRAALKCFHATARLPGFAQRLSALLREFQRHQIMPARLVGLAERAVTPGRLQDKLHDFGLLLQRYRDWLQAHQLQDLDGLLDAATAALQSAADTGASSTALRLGGIWMDGFAELTAQELDLLAAVAGRAERVTLAFCLPGEITTEPSWLSPWTVIGQTYLRCREKISHLPNASVTTEVLPAENQPTRFSANPELARLATVWPHRSAATEAQPPPAPTGNVRLYRCLNPEAEVTLAAREICRHVQAGGRYRDTAVLVRRLEDYAPIVRRVFARYDLPVFLDRRESVAHHPLAELTRSALRTVSYGWRRADWFGALKTGLAPAPEAEIDWLENLALEHGWEGAIWENPFAPADLGPRAAPAEALRQRLVPPFLELGRKTVRLLSGAKLAEAVRALWQTLEVEQTLTGWNVAAQALTGNRSAPIHESVLTQMENWLVNLERAFPEEALPLREWLPILEAGLAQLTVGVIPPTVDQVLVGAVDRSRNPDLQLALALGWNEGVFPAPPGEDPLLNERERDQLQLHGLPLGATGRQRLGHEWFYGYITCTRASGQLILTCAQTDARGHPLNRSPFFDHLLRVMPGLELKDWQLPEPFAEVRHVNEIIAPAIRLDRARGQPADAADAILGLPSLAGVLSKARQYGSAAQELFTAATAEQLYGRELSSSVSALENFAACPFKFFAGHGLRAQERKEFELDARERGTFQHEVLTQFHEALHRENLRWRDLLPEQARDRVRRLATDLAKHYRQGLLVSDAARRFAADRMIEALETLIGVLVGWARDYQFDPWRVETGFGLGENSPWPAWRLELDANHALLLRGRIDRVDAWRDPATGAGAVVVMDYKSGPRKLDDLKLHHGLQLQLPAYLVALESLPEVRAELGTNLLAPAGVFYVNLRGEFNSEKTRAEALAGPEDTLRAGFQHPGRFDASHRDKLDPRHTAEQFRTGNRSRDAMDAAAFRHLLDRTVENLKRFGNEIYAGRIAPDPFRKSSETACDWCEYAAICRFDPWTQPFRTLAKPAPTAPPDPKPKPKRVRKGAAAK